jgi:hypothetical protein
MYQQADDELLARLGRARRRVVRTMALCMVAPFGGLAWIIIAGMGGASLFSLQMVPGLILFTVGGLTAGFIINGPLYRRHWVCPRCAGQLPRDAYPGSGRRGLTIESVRRPVNCASCKTAFGMH